MDRHRGRMGTARLELPQQRVLEKATPRQHRQPRRLADHPQIRVLVEHRKVERHRRLDPGRAVIGQALAPLQKRLRCGWPIVKANLARLNAIAPFRLAGVALALGVVLEQGLARPGRVHATAIDSAVIQIASRGVSPERSALTHRFL